MTEPKEHCDHENPCGWWGCYDEDTPCNREGCKDDTRSRPHTPASVPALDDIDTYYNAGYEAAQKEIGHPPRCWTGCACRTPECEEHCVEWLSEMEHDTAIRKHERDLVLDKLEALERSGNCPPGKNNFNCGDSDCSLCCIESLRESGEE